MSAHIIASMIGQVLRMCSAYLVLSARTQALLPLPARQKFFFFLFLFMLQSPLPYGRCEWVVGQVISPGVSPGLLVTSTREVMRQVKGQGSVA